MPIGTRRALLATVWATTTNARPAGEFDPLGPLEDAIEVYGDLTCFKEMWVMENQFHPIWHIDNFGGLDCHHYVPDWFRSALLKDTTNEDRVAYATESGDGSFGDCEWVPTVGPRLGVLLRHAAFERVPDASDSGSKGGIGHGLGRAGSAHTHLDRVDNCGRCRT